MEKDSYKRCWVKYLKGEKQGQFETVCSSRFKNHAFQNCTFRKDLRYKLKDEHDELKLTRVQSLHVTETQKQMDKKLAVRVAPTPVKFLETDQASDNETIPSPQPTKKSTFKPKTQSEYSRIIQERKSEKVKTAKRAKSDSENESDDVNAKRNKRRRLDSNNTETESEPSESDAIIESVNEKASKFDDELSVNNKLVRNSESRISIAQNKDSKKVPLVQNDKTKVRSSEFKITKIADVVPIDVLQLKEKQIAEWKKTNKSLDKKYRGLKGDFKQLNSKYEDLHAGNLKIVQDVSNDIKEIKVLIQQKNKIEHSSGKSFDPHLNNYPVGFFVKEKGIHLGCNVFMDENTHANLISDSTSPSMFVGNILLAVYTKEVLLVSTITGRGSNRNTKEKATHSQEVDTDDETDDETRSDDSRAQTTGGDDESLDNNTLTSKKDKQKNRILKLDSNKLNACKGKLEVRRLILKK